MCHIAGVLFYFLERNLVCLVYDILLIVCNILVLFHLIVDWAFSSFILMISNIKEEWLG
jgi:hypothetical protein